MNVHCNKWFYFVLSHKHAFYFMTACMSSVKDIGKNGTKQICYILYYILVSINSVNQKE